MELRTARGDGWNARVDALRTPQVPLRNKSPDRSRYGVARAKTVGPTLVVAQRGQSLPRA